MQEPEQKTEPKSEPQKEREPEKKIKPEKEIQKSKVASDRKQVDEYLTPKEVSELFHTSEKTLANWRSQGRGPGYFKLGNKIRYPIEKVKKWFGDQESEEDIITEPLDETETIIRIIQPPKPEHLSEYLTPKELSEKYRLNEQTLANWRYQSKGPKFHKFWNRVYYRIDHS